MTLLPVRTARRLGERLSALPPDLAASFLTIAAFVVFTIMGVLAREVSRQVPVVEMVFLRQVLATLWMAPLFVRVWSEIRTPQKLGLHMLRGVAASVAMVFGITAVIYMPFADATAIQMAEVLFMTALAALILKEQVGWRRWTATAIGFAGVIVMLRPFSGGMDHYAILALIGACFGGITVISIRLGAAYDRIEVVLFYQGLVVLGLLAIPTAFVFVVPSLRDLLVIIAMSIVFVLGQWLFTAALRIGKAAALAPLHYLRLILMAVTGYILYNEVPTTATIIGALMIVGAASYTLRRNAIRHGAAPPAGEQH